MLDRGELASMAGAAWASLQGRITQIIDLLMLAPEIQEEVLFGRDARGICELMAVCRRAVWAEQRKLSAGTQRAVA